MVCWKRKNTKDQRDTKRDFVNCRKTEIENVTKERSKAFSVEIMNLLKQMKNRDRQRDKFQGSHHCHAAKTIVGEGFLYSF